MSLCFQCYVLCVNIQKCLLSFVTSISLPISPLEELECSEEILPSVLKLCEVLVRVTVWQ